MRAWSVMSVLCMLLPSLYTAEVTSCDQSDFYNVCGEHTVILPEDCTFLANVLEYVSFTSSNGVDPDAHYIDVTRGSDVQLQCKAKAAREGGHSSLTMWMCRASLTTFPQCLCPQKVTVPGGEDYSVEYVYRPKSDGIIQLNHSLPNVDYTSNDTYYCVVQESFGDLIDGFAQFIVNVRDEMRPEIIRSPTNKTVQVGMKVTLSCEASGFPIPTYTWWKNGKPIDADNSTRIRIDSLETTNRLLINATILEDSGHYRCVATNLLGEVTTNIATLDVIKAPMPPSIKVHGDNKEIVPISLGVTGAVLAILAIITVVCVYKWSNRRHAQQEDQLRQNKAEVKIHSKVDTNNMIINIEGHGNEVTFHGDVIVGGGHVADRMAGPDHEDEDETESGGSVADSDFDEDGNVDVHLLNEEIQHHVEDENNDYARNADEEDRNTDTVKNNKDEGVDNNDERELMISI
ncbi:uncharacterized protein LOC144441887 [Glandiceps talaboti]